MSETRWLDMTLTETLKTTQEKKKIKQVVLKSLSINNSHTFEDIDDDDA